MITPTHELTGQTLDGRYRLDALLGSGGFGATAAGAWGSGPWWAVPVSCFAALGSVTLWRRGFKSFLVGAFAFCFAAWTFFCSTEVNEPDHLRATAALLGLAGLARMIIPPRNKP